MSRPWRDSGPEMGPENPHSLPLAPQPGRQVERRQRVAVTSTAVNAPEQPSAGPSAGVGQP